VSTTTPNGATDAHGGASSAEDEAEQRGNLSGSGQPLLQCPEQTPSLENCTNLLLQDTQDRLKEFNHHTLSDGGLLSSIVNTTTHDVLRLLETTPSDDFYAALVRLVVLHPSQSLTLGLGLIAMGWLAGLIGAILVIQLKRRSTGRSFNANSKRL
jgi:hypothetical protein